MSLTKERIIDRICDCIFWVVVVISISSCTASQGYFMYQKSVLELECKK